MYADKRFDIVEAPVKPELTEERITLLAAAEYIRQHGWCQNQVETHDGRVCTVGAMGKVTIHKREMDCSAAAKRFVDFNKIEPGFIGRWNDAPGRTKEEVIAALEAAAK